MKKSDHLKPKYRPSTLTTSHFEVPVDSDDDFVDDETVLEAQDDSQTDASGPEDGQADPPPPETPEELQRAAELAAERRKYLARQIRKYIIKLSSRITKTGLRCLIDRYIPLVNENRKNGGEAAFPLTLLCHPSNVTRAQVGGYNNLLCHYIGMALQSYYTVCRGETCEHMDDRLADLRDIALLGPQEFVVVGSDRDGWMLVARDVAKVQAARRAKSYDAGSGE